MSKEDPRVDDLRDALRIRASSIEGKASGKRGVTRGRMPSTSIEEDIETAERVIDRQGIDAAARFLSRRTGLDVTTCLEVLRRDKRADDKLKTPEGVEDALINEAFVGGKSFGEMALLILQRMKHRGHTVRDVDLTDEEISMAARDLVEVLEMLCLGNVSPARLLRAALEKYDLLQEDPESAEFDEHVVNAARKHPLDLDIRRVFP